MKNSLTTTLTATNSSNVRNDGLTPSQERAIEALLTARSIAAAAREAHVGESTCNRRSENRPRGGRLRPLVAEQN